MTFDPKKLMRQAIDVMKASKMERRADGKIVPRVGAVLWKPDGSVDTASRGELRDGDHAEYTLLERKHANESLDGCVVFATLEPCAPDARTPPKIGCARRIVLARIKKVYIGIEDPDPKVDRKGIKYLQDNGVEVEMFPRELQEEIREANRDFLEQAAKRAMEAEEEATAPKLSGLEDPANNVSLSADFSPVPLQRFAAAAGITEGLNTPAFSRRLKSMGLVETVGGEDRPTGYGLILFGKAPEENHPHARLLATIHYPDGKEEAKDFGGPLVEVPGKVEQWLSDKLPNTLDRSRMQRREVPALPMEVVREGIVNALVHRDYDIHGAKCQLVVTPNLVTIKSPGAPLPPITLEHLNSFKAPMLSRNPRIQFVFNRLGLSEERGLGMKTLKGLQENHGLPLPRYSYEAPYLVLTIFRHAEAELPIGRSGDPLELTDTERTIWRRIRSSGDSFRTSDLLRGLEVDRRTVQRILHRFTSEGLIEPIGTGRGASYRILV